jgi:hypothetical protein
MRLVFDEAKNDLSASAFQVARPANVSLFVKARFQLHKRGD